MKRIGALAAILMLAACNSPTNDETASENAEKAIADASATSEVINGVPQPVVLSDSEKGRVCRAIIASLNGRDPAIIHVISTKTGIHRVRYTRDDGKVWTNECRVGNGTAEWRIVENGQPGRWRDEDTIRFTIDGPMIGVQTFMMGEPVTNDTYRVE